MSEQTVVQAVNATLKAQESFCKFLSANDSGETRSHQSGILISKTSKNMLFTDQELEENSILNKEALIKWQDSFTTTCKYSWFKGKNELRLSGFGRGFPLVGSDYTNALFILIKESSEYFWGYLLNTDDDKREFVEVFDIDPNNPNKHIDFDAALTRIIEKESQKDENIIKQNNLISCCLEQIAPFNPNKMSEKEVYVRAEDINALMDEDERIKSGTLLVLDVNTPESIKTKYNYFVHERNNNYIPFEYTFTVTGKTDEYTKRTCELFNKYSQSWIKGKLKSVDTFNSGNGIKGHLYLSYGLADTESAMAEVPLELDAVLELEEIIQPANDGQIEMIAKTDKVVKNILNSSFDDQTSNKGNSNGTLSSDHGNNSSSGNTGDGDKNGQGSGGSNGNSLNKDYRITLYRVGHANAITIEKNGKCILFDFGSEIIRTPYIKSINYIKQHVKPDIIILSHRHRDHHSELVGIDCSNLKAYICPGGFRPALKEPEANLIKRNVKIVSVTPANAPQYKTFLSQYGFDELEINLGEGKSDPGPGLLGHIKYPTIDNDNGILLSLRSKQTGNYLILPGDCSYYSWPQDIQNKAGNIERLIIPHHGGNVIAWDNQKPDLSNCKYAFICGSAIDDWKDRLYDKCNKKLSHFDCRSSCREMETCTYHKSFVENNSNVIVKKTEDYKVGVFFDF